MTPRVFKMILVALAVAGLGMLCAASVITSVDAAAPPPHPPAAHPLAHPPAVHPAVPPPGVRPLLPPAGVVRVVPALRPVVVRRVVTAPTTTVIKTVDDLPAVPSVDTAKDAAYRVVRVGKDLTITLDMNGKDTPVRLLGVAQAEGMEGEGRGNPPMRFLRDLLTGEFVYVVYDSDLEQKDESGNLVAYLYRAPDRLLVNLEMVRQGFGVTADNYAFQYQKVLETYEQRAQADGRGLWGLAKRAAAGGPPPNAAAGP